MFDRKTTMVAIVLFTYAIALLLVLYYKPFEDNLLVIISSIFTLMAFVITFVLSFLAQQLYGRKSAEGKFWFSVNIMLVILLFGFFASQFYSFKVFSVFVAVAFILIAYAILDKMKSSGVKPQMSDLLVAGSAILLILIFISLVMTILSGEGPEDFRMMDYALEFFVVILAFSVTFLTVVMGRLMGEHISLGWYFLAVGAAIFCLSYSFTAILYSFGWYHDGHFIDALNVMALNGVAFSAWYQRRKHLALIGRL